MFILIFPPYGLVQKEVKLGEKKIKGVLQWHYQSSWTKLVKDKIKGVYLLQYKILCTKLAKI